MSNSNLQPANSGNTLALALVPLGVLLNLGVGTLVHVLKLPLFLDAIGTILVTYLIGIRWGAAAGVLSFLVGGLLVNPVMPYFVGTQVAIAVSVGVMANLGWFRTTFRTVVTGVVTGVVAAVASAPVIIKLFGGITGSGSGAITAFLLASGKKVVESVLLTGVSCEPIDKTIQCLIAVWIVKTLPLSVQQRLGTSGYLSKNS